MHVLDPEKTRKIKQLLRHHPRGMTISDLSSKLKMNRNLMAKYLDVLLFSGHVEMQVTGTAKVYFISHRAPISALLEYSSDYILVLDAEEKILQVNTRLLNLLGMERGDPPGKKIEEIDHPLLRAIPPHDLPPDLNQFESKSLEFSAHVNNQHWYFSMKQVPIVFEDGTHGQTLIFEDITERRLAEEKIRTYIHEQEFFSKKLQEFMELPPGADMYAAIGAGLDALLPEAIIDVNAYDPRRKILYKKAIYGKLGEEFATRCSDNQCKWDCSPVYDYVPDVLMSGEIFHLPGKLHYASFRQVPEPAANEIEREFTLGDFYSVGLVWQGNLLGNILFILREGDTIPNVPFIEIYAKAASIALQRQIAENTSKNLVEPSSFLGQESTCTPP